MSSTRLRVTVNGAGDSVIPATWYVNQNICAGENCNRATAMRQMGFCSVECRFWSRVAEAEGGHWEWTSRKNRGGYGLVRIDGIRWLTHRYAYTQLVADIPQGWDIDHLCKHTLCCNPDHLEALPKPEHHKRNDYGGYNRIKTHCKSGHEFTEENTLIVPPSERRPNGGRQCRACIKLRPKEDPAVKRAYDQSRKARNNELNRLRKLRKRKLANEQVAS